MPAIRKPMEFRIREAGQPLPKKMLVKNKVLGMGIIGMKGMRASDKTKWAAQRMILNRDIKRKVAGLILLIHNAGYTKDLK